MRIRVMASRHSAFYSPLLCGIHLLRGEGHEVIYSVLKPGQRSYALIRDGEIDIMQSAVSSNWNALERGVEPLPVHFAQINQRDGFFLVGRLPDPAFDWKKLEGRTLLADHGPQPLAMLKYAVQHNGAEWKKIKIVNAGAPEAMEAAFHGGKGDYVHLQAPLVTGESIASVGASMPAVAFSSLCCAREYQKTEAYRVFLDAYARAREWVRTAPAEEIGAAEASFLPLIAPERLTAAVRLYQALGCWEGGLEIPRELYEQALNVFQAAGGIAWRHRYEEVVG
jgi:ABC-type nitrate/sulfonate/bicarbonate transport system substrate-binding protein